MPAVLTIIKNLKIDTPEFIKKTKKEMNSPKGFAVKSGIAYIHDKKYLAEGNFKTTYIASRVDTNKTDQMEKIVHQKLKKNTTDRNAMGMAVREVRTQIEFNHPNIVRIYDYHIYGLGQKIAIYSEKCDGSVGQAIKEGSLAFNQKVQIGLDIASALAYTHDNGLVHNDIKPDNIYLTKLRGKLGDFGLCKPTNSTCGVFKKIEAPEQQKAEIRFGTEATDVYQFGLTLWHLFHPEPPICHLDDEFKYPQVKDFFYNWTPGNDSERAIQKLIRDCVDPAPEKRPSMKQIENVFADILE